MLGKLSAANRDGQPLHSITHTSRTKERSLVRIRKVLGAPRCIAHKETLLKDCTANIQDLPFASLGCLGQCGTCTQTCAARTHIPWPAACAAAQAQQWVLMNIASSSCSWCLAVPRLSRAVPIAWPPLQFASKNFHMPGAGFLKGSSALLDAVAANTYAGTSSCSGTDDGHNTQNDLLLTACTDSAAQPT